MKSIIFLFCSISFAISPFNGVGQNADIVIDTDVSLTIKQAFRLINKQTDYKFIYRHDLIKTAPNIDLKRGVIKAGDLLDRCLSPINFTYSFTNGGTIVVKMKPMDSSDTSPIKILDEDLQFQVSGTVMDKDGTILPGASILEKGTTNGVQADFDGNFSIDVSNEKAILVASYIGYSNHEVALNGQTSISFTLMESAVAMDEVVVVGYGTQKKSTLTGSVSSVKSDQLTVTPVGNVTNALTGKLPGLIAKQTTGLPGSDQASLSIRGFGNALVIVDGIEANFANLDPNQIESVSILKDGASSIYGARAGNGVILVTTKRGIIQKPSISINSSYTMQGVTNMAKTLNSGDFTQLARESYLNSGKPIEAAPYSAEQVAKYYAGDDPAYPSSDWYNFTFRDWAPQENHNLSIRGGSEKIKYMGYLGYQNQETMVKKNGGDYQRFNIMSNVDADITDNVLLSVDLMATYENSTFAGRGLGNGDGIAWQDLYGTRPWYPTTLPNPAYNAYGGTDVGSVALSTNKDVWGYNLQKPRDYRGAITLSYDVPFINGLKAKAFVNYLDRQTYAKRFQKPYKFYTYNAAADIYTLAGNLWSAAQSNESSSYSKRVTQQYSLNYDRFYNEHHLKVMGMFESIDDAANNFSAARRDFLTPDIEQLFAGSATSQTNNGSASESGRVSVLGRINYSYKDKYLLEAILRADATSKFSEETRWGYFPGVSLGWVISEEDFMEDKYALDILKLRTSYGQSGYDDVGNFDYITGFQISGAQQWDNSFVSGLQTTGLANPFLTWEVMTIYNGGLDFSFQNRKVYGSIDSFYRTRKGIPGTRVISFPSTFGASLPTENINDLSDRGFELMLGTTKNKGDFSYDINANLSWSRAKWDYYDEPEYIDADQKRQNQKSGQWVDRVFGYASDGLFSSMEEIDALPFTYSELGIQNASLRPGDVKYKDINGDGILNWKDQVEIGKGNTPHWMYSLSSTFAFKGFDLATMFQGAFGYSSSSKHYYSNTDTYFDLRWTDATNDSQALIPRPGGSSTNNLTSDYWIKSVFYLRLKNIALGYTLPETWVTKANIDKVRFYISGYNIFTSSTMSKYYIDPEVASGTADRYYPQQRTISFGLNLVF